MESPLIDCEHFSDLDDAGEFGFCVGIFTLNLTSQPEDNYKPASPW